MADYIDRKIATQELNKLIARCPTTFYNGIIAAITALQKIPTADVQKVEHGERK